ncbi:MAG: PEP-CTERM sorting domain-containing protein [Bryobacteraceae bacterium]|nr:PEP-CTERM sorting domain-containing protein [Bryobacteraceae bacterium]
MRILILVLGFSAAFPLLATTASPVPEPATVMLVGGGVAAVILIARKRRQR